MPLIKRYRKPTCRSFDGIVMGGRRRYLDPWLHRVAGDGLPLPCRSRIGFIPDVGATWFLPRMPGELGLYCALTGDRLGLSDPCGPRWPRIASLHDGPRPAGRALRQRAVDALLGAFAEAPGRGSIRLLGLIDRLFTGDSVEGILARSTAEQSAKGAGPRDGCRLRAPHGGLDPSKSRPASRITLASCGAVASSISPSGMRCEIAHSLAPGCSG